jgi:hypothetical protein
MSRRRASTLGEPRAEDEAPLQVASDQAVVLQGYGEPMRGRPGQAGRGHQPGQGGRARLERGEHQGGLVEHAHAAGVVHMAILPSRIMGRKL